MDLATLTRTCHRSLRVWSLGVGSGRLGLEVGVKVSVLGIGAMGLCGNLQVVSTVGGFSKSKDEGNKLKSKKNEVKLFTSDCTLRIGAIVFMNP